jgi:hypothetical protein
MTRVVEIVDVTPRSADDNNLLDSSLPAVPGVQVARVQATHLAHQALVAIVFAAFASESQRRGALNAARNELEDVPSALVVSNDTGRVDLDTGDASAELSFLMAAAAAVLQYSWAWDESELIEVRAGPDSFRFTVHFNGNHAYSVVETAAA